MLFTKTSLYIILGVVLVSIVLVLCWYCVWGKNKLFAASKLYNDLSPGLAKVDLKTLSLSDEPARDLFIAGINVIKTLTTEDYNKNFGCTNIQENQILADMIEQDRRIVTELLGVKESSKVASYLTNPIINFVKDLCKPMGGFPVEKSQKDKLKTVIDRIQKDQSQYNVILTKTIPAFDANIVEVVICYIEGFYGLRIAPDMTKLAFDSLSNVFGAMTDGLSNLGKSFKA